MDAADTPRWPHRVTAVRPGRERRRRRGVVAAMLMAVLLGAGLSGCGGGDDSSSGAAAEPVSPAQAQTDSGGGAGGSADTSEDSTSGQGGPAVPDDQAKSQDESAATGGSVGSASTVGSVRAVAESAAGSKRVRTADLQVRVTDTGAAAAKVRAVAIRLGGSVASEDSRTVEKWGADQDVLVLRVPEPKLDEAMSAVAGIGTELARTSSSEDVTAVLADLESRERSQQASVDRIRTLMAKATSLQDIVLLESELSRRQTDLEAAQASRRALSDQAAQATLTVTLSTDADGNPGQDPDDDSGFVAGLKKSWHAVQVSTTALLTIIGAVLPFAIAFAVIGWPVYLLVRRNQAASRRPSTRPTATPPSSPATPPSGP